MNALIVMALVLILVTLLVGFGVTLASGVFIELVGVTIFLGLVGAILASRDPLFILLLVFLFLIKFSEKPKRKGPYSERSAAWGFLRNP